MNPHVVYSICFVLIFLLWIAAKNWQQAAADYRKKSIQADKDLLEAKAQIVALQKIVKDISGIYALLGQRQALHSNDQIIQLELLSKSTEDFVQRELKMRTDLQQILEHPALTQRQIKEAIEQILG
jgi:hypothetical protein